MNAPNHSDWKPDSQLLAAYFDGELEGCDDLVGLRARVEIWLEHHPEAAAAGAEQHQLRRLWLDTTPREPSAGLWDRTLDRIDAERRKPAFVRVSRRPWLTVSLYAASIALIFGVLFGALRYSDRAGAKKDPVAVAPREKPNQDDVEVFPVALANGVVILHIDGADTMAVAVGELPVQGPLLLADPGEVHVFTIRHNEDENSRTHVHTGPSRPMIWARLDAE